MAEDNQNSAQEKTEQPTQRKIDKAKEEGKTVTSKEMYVLSSIVVLLGIMYIFSLNFNYVIANWKTLFSNITTVKDGLSPIVPLKDALFKIFIISLLVGIPTLIITIFTQLMVGGITFSFKAIEWKSSKIDPIAGLKRIFSMKGLVELIKGILKVFLLFGVGFYLLYIETPALVQLSTESFENSLITAAGFFPILGTLSIEGKQILHSIALSEFVLPFYRYKF